jgi:hypothetical protein
MSTTDPDRAIIELFTEAPTAYDGFSARTVAVVGTSKRGNPVRKVTVERRDHEWLVSRYASGMYATTSPHMSLDDFVRLGDWTLDPAPPAGERPQRAYCYATEHGEPLMFCPYCGGNLREEGTVMVHLVRGNGVTCWEEATCLDDGGNLIDLGAIARGFHSQTLCGHCSEPLTAYEIGTGTANAPPPGDTLLDLARAADDAPEVECKVVTLSVRETTPHELYLFVRQKYAEGWDAGQIGAAAARLPGVTDADVRATLLRVAREAQAGHCRTCGKPIADDPPRFDTPDQCRACERALNVEWLKGVLGQD